MSTNSSLQNLNDSTKKAAHDFAVASMNNSLNKTAESASELSEKKKLFVMYHFFQFGRRPSEAVFSYWSKYHDSNSDLHI